MSGVSDAGVLDNRRSEPADADGRVTRGQRNREAIIDALLECYEAGSLRPSIEEVATRAGVSARSVHNHFVDVESLRAEVAQRQWERHFHGAIADLSGSTRSRIDAIIAARAAVYEAITPVRRAALLSVHDSPAIASNLARLDRRLRRQLQEAFPDCDRDTLDALDAALSWDTWNRLRNAQHCTPARARRVLDRTVTALLEETSI
jgi:TetR/AcrR family transcriptional regulator, regulator of autoinduction and epiphytic fitness